MERYTCLDFTVKTFFGFQEALKKGDYEIFKYILENMVLDNKGNHLKDIDNMDIVEAKKLVDNVLEKIKDKDEEKEVQSFLEEKK